MKSILVTGAAGFIGTHLCERLLNEGFKVIGIDNLSLGTLENMKDFRNHKNFKYHFVDVFCMGQYQCLDNYTFDAVFHLAANSDIRNNDPDVEFRNTLSTTYKMLEFCRTHEIKEFIFPSSGSVYGEPLVNDAIPETFGPCLPISHYAAAKLASEAFISSYSSMHDIKAWICRFPNVIGEHATHGAILDFINKIRKNPDVLEVLGDGSQTKPYLYVKDLVDAVLFIWKNADDVINLYNIAGIGLTSVKEIAEMVITQMGTNTKIQYTGGDRGWKGDSPYYYPDISKLDKLGWMPTFDSSSSVELSIKNILDETKA